MSFLSRLFGREDNAGDITLPLPRNVREVLAPRTVRDLLAVSVWCDDSTCSLIRQAYNELFPGEGKERITHLNQVARKVSAKSWQEVFPFIPSLFWCICYRSLSPDEARTIPIIGRSFVHDGSLGLLTTKAEDVIFMRIQPTRRCGIIPPFAPIGEPFDIRFAKNQMKNDGWKNGKV